MESLQNYGSDEDSCSELEKESVEEEGTSSLRSNYFNLDSGKSATANGPNQYNEHSMCNETEKKDTTFEIPDSEFWTGFDPSQIHSDVKSVDIFRSQTCRKHQCDNQKPSTTNKKFQNNQLKRKIDSAVKEKSSSEKRICLLNNYEKVANVENRKIFFIHNKVMPGLSVKSVCKCPTALDYTWPCHDSAINRLSWNRPDFSHLVATAGMDSVIKIWNVWSRLDKCVSVLTTHSKAVRTVIWGNTGRNIISASYDKAAAITDVETGAVLCQFDHQGFVTACAKHPSNTHCIVTGSENVMQMWDQRRPSTPVKVFQFKENVGQIQDILFIQDGQELLSSSDVVARDSADKTIMAWDVKSGVVLSNQIFQERYTCNRLKLHPSNSHFLAQTQGGYIAAFSTCRPYKMDKSKRFDGHQMQGYNIGFDVSHDGKFVYSGSAEGGIHCYDYRSGRTIRKCSANKNIVITDVACHPVLSSVLAACTWGGHISVWR